MTMKNNEQLAVEEVVNVTELKTLPLKTLSALQGLSLLSTQRQLEELQEKAESIVITTHDAEGIAADIAVEARKVFTALEHKRKEIVKPANDYVAKVNNAFKRFTSAAQRVIDTCEEKVKLHRQEEERRRREQIERELEERRRLEAERAKQEKIAAKKGLEPPAPLPPPPPIVATVENVARGKESKAVGKKVKKWRVVDEAAIPESFWMLNEKMIEAAVRTGQDVPGIEVYYEDEIVFSRR